MVLGACLHHLSGTFLLEAADTPVHRSRTQLKRAVCVKIYDAKAAPPLAGSSSEPTFITRTPCNPGPWEVRAHFFVIVALIYFPHSAETGQEAAPAGLWEVKINCFFKPVVATLSGRRI